MKIKISLTVVGAVSCLLSTPTLSEDYPYSLPDDISAKVSVTTTTQEKFNDLLLGTNIFDFSTDTEQNLIRKFDPITVRFPHGLWANWYDWHTDTLRVFGEEQITFTDFDGTQKTRTIDHLSSLKIFEQIQKIIGINGLASLNAEKVTNLGSGYDMLWTFNMSADGTDYTNGSPETLAFYNDLVARGLEVNSIELGNENFYVGQRSSIIPNVADYIERAKSMSAVLKTQDSDIRVSIPVVRRDNQGSTNWNEDVTADLNYFDAVTVHTYVGADPDDPSVGDDAYGTALVARHHLGTSVDDYIGKLAPNKPVWLSEWGVKSGGPNGASVLGMADAYIFMSQNQHRYERANWFSVNGQLNSFLVWEDFTNSNGVTRPRIKQPYEKTAFGSTHEILRDVFEGSTMLTSEMTSPDLIDGVDAVSSRVVVKDGKTTVLVLNLTNKAVPFSIDLDGTEYTGSFEHKAFAFNAMGQEVTMPFDDAPLALVNSGNGDINLPKYSISTIELTDAVVDEADYTSNVVAPYDGSTYVLGQNIALRANVESSNADIRQVNFRINGNFYKQDNAAPYQLSYTPPEVGTYTIDVVAIDVNGKRKTSSLHTFTVADEDISLPDPKPPLITFPAPTMTVFEGYEKLVLTFLASSPEPDRTIVSVTLSINGNLVRKDTRPIWNFGHAFNPHETGAMGWLEDHEPNPNPLGVGSHTFTAVAEDSAGLTTETSMILIVKPLETLLGDLDNDDDVDRDDVRAFSIAVRTGSITDLEYDFNNDGTVNSRDVSGLASLCTRSRCATE